MKNKKPIVLFDLETTGLDQKTDRIIEIYMYRENLDGTTEELFYRINPYPVMISPEATSVHGISNEDLLSEPKFESIAKEIIQFIEGCDIGGYNILHFDIPILFEELYRCGIVYNFRNHRVFDSYKIWVASESRTLSGAVKRYLGEEHKRAHSAKADVEVTARILKKQIEEYSSLYENEMEMADRTAEVNKRIDFAGKFGRNSEGNIIITFGKHKDKTIDQIQNEDPGYIQWIAEKADFPTHTKLIAKNIYNAFANSKK